MKKLFDVVSLENDEGVVREPMTMEDMVASEENMVELLSLENELHRDIELIASSEAIADELSIEMNNVLSSEELSVVNAISLKHSYINACKNVGCMPVEISTEDIEESLKVSTEGIKEVINKIVEAIKKLYTNIALGIKKLYTKVLVALSDDSKKADALFKQFSAALSDGKIPKDSNWRFSEGTRNSLYAKMSGAIFFQGKDEPLVDMLDFVLTSHLAHVAKTDKIRVSFSDKAFGGKPLEKDFEKYVVKNNQLVFEDNCYYYPVTVNGSSIGIVKLVEDDNDTVADFSYFRVNLLPLLAGQKVTSNYKNNGTYTTWDEEYKMLPENFSSDDLAFLSAGVSDFSKASKNMYEDFLKTMKENEAAVKKIADVKEPTDEEKKELVLLQKIALTNNKLMLDDLIGKLKLSKACLSLLSIQSYSFDKK